MKLTKREKSLLIISVFVLIIILFINYVYLPLNNDIKSLERKSSGLNQELEEIKVKEEKIKALEGNLITLNEELEGNMEGVAKNWDEPEVIVFIENIIHELSNKLLLKMEGVFDYEAYYGGLVGLEFASEYSELKSILKSFENADYFNTIDSIRIEDLSDTEDAKRNLDVELTLKVYKQENTLDFQEEYLFMNGKHKKTNIFAK